MPPFATTTVTLADIAAHLGVSRTTVSNAYNRPNQLSPKLRERVLAAAGELGYGGPDPMARGLRRGQTGSLGLVFDAPLSYAFTDPAATLFLKGMASGLEVHGAALSMIPRLPEGPERSAELVRSALVDGYMLFCTRTDDPRYTAVRARGLPFVLIEYDDDPTAAHVGIGDVAGAEAAARHLVAHGHRRVAIVSGYETDVVAAREARARSRFHVQPARLAGWRAGLEAGGIDWGAVPVSGARGWGVAGGARAAAALLARARRPPAVLARSDLQAVRGLRARGGRASDAPGQASPV